MIKILDRVAHIPEYDRVLGCCNDNLVEERHFYVYDTSLADFSFKIAVKCDDDTENVIDLDKEICDDVIILKWKVERAHLTRAGIMPAQLYAFKEAGDDILKWHTLNIMNFTVNLSIPEGEAFDAVLPSEIEQIEKRMTACKEEAAQEAEAARQAAADALDAGAAAVYAKEVAAEEKNEAVLAAEDAKEAAEAATKAYSAAQSVAVKTPYIGENGNWFIWSTEKSSFIDSGEKAMGDTPNITVGDVTTVDSFEKAAVTRREGSNDENPILDFALPRGVSGVYVGSGEMPEGYNIQIDPLGTESEAVISAHSIYDTVINSQEEWEALVSDPTFGGARNILLNCDVEINDAFPMAPSENGAYIIPSTVKSIAGGGHAINFYMSTKYWRTFSFAGCSLRDIQINIFSGFLVFDNIKGMYNCKCEVEQNDSAYYYSKSYIRFINSSNIYDFSCVTGELKETGCYFINCTNLYHCELVEGTCSNMGFSSCKNLISCTVFCQCNTAFSNCENLIGCFAEVYACAGSAIGYEDCEQLANCKTSVGSGDCGYKNCSYLSNCTAELSDSSSTGFAGANIGCDSETCKEIDLSSEEI